MRHTVSERRKKWFFLRSMFRAFWEHLDKHRSETFAKAKPRPLFAEALEPRVLFSAAPVPVDQEEPVDEAPVAQEAEMPEAPPALPPVDNTPPYNFEIVNPNGVKENLLKAQIVGYFKADDLQPQKLGYSLVAGEGDRNNNDFRIDSGNILVYTGVADFEAAPKLSIRAQVSDGAGGVLQQIFTIDVVDDPKDNVIILNSPPTNLQLSNSVVSEGAAPNTVVGVLSADDADGDKLSFRFGKPATPEDYIIQGSFSIVGDTLYLSSPRGIAGKPFVMLSLVVSDEKGGILTKDFKITVTPATTGTTDVVVDGSGNLNITDADGGDTSDDLVLKVDGTDFLVTDTGNSVDRRISVNSITGDIVINGSGGDDTFTIDLTGGAVTRNIVYNGGVGGFDTLRIIGTGGEVVTYNPDTLTYGNGVIDLGNGHTITFTGLEPVDVIGVGTFNLTLTGANDIIDISNGLTGGGDAALVLSGTSGGVAFELANVRNVANVIINTTSVDGNDSITVTSANNAHGNGNLQIITGNTGTTDVVNINGALTISGDLLIQTRALNINALVTAANATFQPQTTSTVRIGDGAVAGNMVLSQNALTNFLAVAGTVTIGRADATGVVTIQDLNTTGESYDLSIIGGGQVNQTLGTTGSLIVDGNLSISANQVTGGTQDFDMGVGTSIQALGTLTISVGSTAGSSISNLRQVTADSDILITSAGSNSITLNGSLTSNTSTVSITSGNALTVSGTVSAQNAVTLTAGGSFVGNQNVQSSTGDVTVNANANITLSASISALGGANIFVTANADGGNETDILTVNTSASFITAGGDVVFRSGTGVGINADAVIGGTYTTGGGDLRITGDDVITFNAMTLEIGTGDLIVSAKDAIAITGLISVTSGATLRFTADDDLATGAAAFSMTGSGAISGSAESVVILAQDTTGNVTLRSITAGEITVTTVGGGDILLSAGQTLTANTTDVTLTSSGEITLTGDATNGAISAQNNVEIDAVGGITIAQEVEAIDGFVDIASSTAEIATTLVTADLLAGTTVTLNSATNTTLAGDIVAFDGVTVTAADTATINGGVTVIDPAATIDITGTVEVVLGTSASLTSGAGNITLTAGTGVGTTADVTIRGSISTSGGSLTVDADDNIDFDASGTTLTLGSGDADFNAKGSITLNHTINVVSGDTITFNVNTGLNATDDFDMTGVNAKITGNASAIVILAHSSSATHTLRDIETGVGGTVTVTTTGNGTTELAANTKIDADGLVAFSTVGSLDILGVVDSGSGRIDIQANNDNTGAHTFTMGAEAALRNTNSSVLPASPAISIVVGTTTAAASVREITTNGLVRIDMNGTAGITQTNTTLGGAGISASGAGDVIIDSEAALTVNGTINAGSGSISLTADSSGDTETHDLTIASTASLSTTSTSATAVQLIAGTTGLLADVDLAGTITTGNGGGIVVTSADNLTLGTSSLNVGVSGSISLSAKDTVTFSGVVTVQAANTLTVNANTDAGGTVGANLVMNAGAGIAAGITGAALIDININSTTGNSTIRDIASATNGTIDIDANGSGALNFTSGTVGSALGGNLTILINGEGAVGISNTINAGSGTVAISANSAGVDTDSLTGTVSGSVTTTNSSATAIVIDVNAGGGTGTANLANLSVGSGGTITVMSRGGTIATVAGTTVNAPSGTILLNGTDLAVNGTSNLTAVGGSILLQRSTSGAMGINTGGATVFRVDDAEIGRMSAANLVFGDSNSATNLVTGIDVINGVNTTAEISGMVTFNTPGNVSFGTGTVAVFNALTINADQEANGTGSFVTTGIAAISTAAANGNIVINAADFALSLTTLVESGSGNISLLPTGTGRTVELGGSGLGLNVTLSEFELDSFSTTGTLRIGNTVTGAITISDAITRPGGIGNTVITTSGAVIDSSNSLNDYAGSSLVIDGNFESGATPALGVFTVTGSFTLAANNTFRVDLHGNAAPVAGTHYDQIKVTPSSPTDTVTIGANVLLEILQSGADPIGRTEYKIIDNGTALPVSGLFVNADNNAILNEGDIFELGVFFYQITYQGGDGNDVVIKSLGPVETEATLDANGNLLIDDIENTDTDDTLTFTVVGNNLRITDANYVLGFNGVPGAVRIDPFTIEIPLASFSGLIVRTGYGDDVINLNGFSGTTTFTDFLLVDGGIGTDTINLNADYNGSGATNGTAPEAPANRAVELRADTIRVAAGIEITTTAVDGTISLVADRNVALGIGAQVETVNGDILIEGSGTGSGRFKGVSLEDVDVTSSTGDITITGSGGDSLDRNYGVEIIAGGSVTTSGIVTIEGTGGGTGSDAHQLGVFISGTTVSGSAIDIDGTAGTGSTNSTGVTIDKGASLTVSTGNLTVDGTGGTSASNNRGVSMSGITLSATGTSIVVQGTGNGSTTSEGLEIRTTVISNTGNGTITLRGTGAAGASTNVGVSLAASTQILTANGDILIEGTSLGTVATNHGISVLGGSAISASGSGDITLIGTGGVASTSGSGVLLNGSSLQAQSGNLTLTGTGRALSSGRGVDLSNSILTSATGSIQLTGSGSATATGTSNIGVYVNGSTINLNQPGGIATLVIQGTGGGGTTANHGVQVTGGAGITSVAGNVEITGQAGGTEGSAAGVSFLSSSTVTVGGSGDLTVTGTGSASGSATTSQNRGIQVASSTLSVLNGDLTLTGLGGGAGNGTTNHGIDITGTATNRGTVRSTGAGNLIISGTGGAGGNGLNGNFASLTTTSGDITAIAFGGTGSGNVRGIFLTSSILTTSAGGDVSLSGTANAGTTGSGNAGVWIISSTIGSSSSFAVNGTGGGGSGTNHGVYMQTITNSGGAVTATGTAGAGATSLDEAGNFFP